MRFSMHPNCAVLVLAWTAACAAEPVHAVEGMALSVRDASGPIEGASVRWPGGEALSDAAGVVRLPDGVVPSCATSQGHVPALLDAVTESGRAILLAKSTSLRGRALSADGKPVEGVKIRPEGDDELGPCARIATSDAQGAWTLHGLGAQGARELLVEAPAGWLPARDSLRASPRLPSLDVRLLAAVDPVVTVTDSAGAPLPGASVRIETDPEDLRLEPGLGARARERISGFEATTGLDGRVTLPRLPSAVAWRISARHSGHAPASVSLAGGALAAPAMTLTPGGMVSLRALDGAAVALTGIRARVLRGPDADLVPTSPPTGADGILAMRHLPVGTCDLRLEGPGVRPLLLRGVAIKERSVSWQGDVTLEPGVDLRGIVRSASRPLEDARLTLWTIALGENVKRETTTDADGRFVFEGLDPEAKADVQASAEDHVAERRNDLEPGDEPLEFELARAATIVVLARDAATLEPAAGATVDVTRSAPGSRAATAPGEAPGEVLVTGLTEGPADLVVRAPGYLSEARREVPARISERSVVEVDLSEGASVEGRIVDGDTGAGIPFADIRVQAQSARALSDAEGRFMLEGVRAPLDVLADHPRYVPGRALAVDPAQLPADGLRIELDRGGSVEGVVFGLAGSPLPGAQVRAGDADAAVADAEGRYRLDGLTEGSHRLTKTDAPGAWEGWETAVVSVRRGAVTKQDFGTGRRIVGRVTDAGEPAAGAWITALRADAAIAPLDSDSAVGRSDADGRYVLAVPAPGTYGLSVDWRDMRFGRQATVAADAREVVVDLPVPQEHLAGIVVDDETGEPLEGVTVTLLAQARQSAGGGSSKMSMLGADGTRQEVVFQTDPSSSARTGGDGSFRLLVQEQGPSLFWAWREGFDHWSAPDDFSVGGSRDDVVIRLRRKSGEESWQLLVQLVDDLSGEPIMGTTLIETRSADGTGSSRSSAGMDGALAPAPKAGETTRVIAWTAGRGIAHRADIGPTGEDIRIVLRLPAQGSLRLLVPRDTITASASLGWQGDLQVRLASGLVLSPDSVNVQASIVSKIAREVAPGEWLLDDLPAGMVSAAIGEGEWHAAEIVPGTVTEMDLR